jgi:hypothetical protein
LGRKSDDGLSGEGLGVCELNRCAFFGSGGGTGCGTGLTSTSKPSSASSKSFSFRKDCGGVGGVCFCGSGCRCGFGKNPASVGFSSLPGNTALSGGIWTKRQEIVDSVFVLRRILCQQCHYVNKVIIFMVTV